MSPTPASRLRARRSSDSPPSRLAPSGLAPSRFTASDRSPRARAPRSLAHALDHLTAELAPVSVLGQVHTVWERAAGPAIAASAAPVAERDGVLTVLCESSVWAHELEMLSRELAAAINAELGFEAVAALRCRTG